MVDLATRAFVLALKTYSTKTTEEIAAICGLSRSTVNRIFVRACERGYDPNLTPVVVKDSYLEDAPRTGRPSKQDLIKEPVLAKINLDRLGQEKSCADLASELRTEGTEVSATTVWRTLRLSGIQKTKPTRKPRLTKKLRAERLA
ncbi:hypothetical protein F1880_001764 [Penicillium rolfsii]|nr:hypothetical protein F1880_001764 [Penicillium rolfsii]